MPVVCLRGRRDNVEGEKRRKNRRENFFWVSLETCIRPTLGSFPIANNLFKLDTPTFLVWEFLLAKEKK
jgi:hypothetical protein